jgi:hypothetical protein
MQWIDHIVVAVRDLARAGAAYERLGFTLTPRAEHPPSMGTANRLAQFAGRNFIELLEVDRPLGQIPFDLAQRPPRFGFGVQNRRFLESREGMSMLVLASDDARGDLARLTAAGATTYAPVDFERRAKLPDGQEVTVAFSLGFVTDAAMPELGFFFCQQHFPEHFWKPQYQRHANGAQSIRKLWLVADTPERHGAFLSTLTGGAVSEVPGGIAVACGGGEELRVLTPDAIRAIAPDGVPAPRQGPAFAGIGIATSRPRPATPAAEAQGLFIVWSAA